MTPEQIERVFGRGRLKMVTGEHVEVFREAVVPGERRRYTKRFLNSTDGDFAHWTEREWRILARLIGHGIGCVPDVVQFDRGSAKGAQLVQTYDAGVTVDQWATLLPLYRDGHVYRHAFEDCAHWWALAHYCLKALKEIHQLQLIHLDIKGDNVCIPFGPASFDPEEDDAPLYPLFGQLALIDFAFSLVSGESLTVALPIGWQREYDYQSPRLLQALIEGHDGDLRKTRELDWRCDIYSLAAMLKRYLPDDVTARTPDRVTGWTSERYDAAKALIVTLRQHHDRDAPLNLPHQAMIDATGAMLSESDLAQSLAGGWTLARDIALTSGMPSPLTPMTRIAPPVRVFRKPRERVKEAPHEPAKEVPYERGKEVPQERPVADSRGEPTSGAPPGQAATDLGTPPLVFAAPTDLRMARAARRDTGIPLLVTRRNDGSPPPPERRARARVPVLAIVLPLALGAAVAHQVFPDATKGALDGARGWFAKGERGNAAAPSAVAKESIGTPPSAADPATKPDPAREPATKLAAAEVPASSATSPNSASTAEAPPTAPEDDSADVGNTESGDAGAPAPKSKADSAVAPPTPRTSPRAAPQPGESSRAAAKRPATKSPPPPLARSPAPSMPATTAKTPSGRYATSTPRGSGVTLSPYKPGGGSAPTSLETTRVETAPPAQIVELAPPSSLPARTEAPPAAGNPPAIQPQDRVSNPESTAAATKPSSPRRARPLAADEEWRAGLNAVARFLGFTQRKTAPIEERGFREVTPPAKPLRAPQVATPSEDRPVTAIPKADLQPLVAAPPEVPVVPRIDTPPPTAWTPPPSRPTTPTPTLADARADFRAPDRMRESDYAREARRALVQSVPRIALQTQSEVAPVLWAAAKAQDPRAEREVVDSAQAISGGDGATAIAQPIEPTAARRLNEEAMRAYWVRRNIPEAFDLSLKAFGANPNDPEVVGNLAFLHLRMSPSQPETARQLALHALAVRGTRFRTGRLEDWNTFALASAMTGREADARNAMYVTVALAGSVERNCKAGLSALANYGERVREPVEAMMYRIHAQGRSYDSPYCAWPPNGAIGMRRQ